MNIVSKLTDLIGNTPMLRLDRYCEANDVPLSIVAKLEYFNPAGSVKDRIAYNMICKAEENGDLKSVGLIF